MAVLHANVTLMSRAEGVGRLCACNPILHQRGLWYCWAA